MEHGNTFEPRGDDGEARARDDLSGAGVWALMRGELERKAHDADDLRWIEDLRLVAEVDGEMMLAARDQLAFDRVTGRIERMIKSVWKANDPASRKLQLICWRTAPADLRALVDDPWIPAPPVLDLDSDSGDRDDGPSAAPAMTFATLVTGPSNETAAALAQRLANGQPVGTSTILIYGPQGTGKTHLLHALRNASAEALPDRKIVYLTAEEFMSSYHDGVRAKDTSALKRRLRAASVLLIDDLQRIAGKPGTETELYQNIREVTANGGQVVLVGDQAPSETAQFGPRMRGEIKGAIAVEVGLPDASMRRDILQRLAVHIVQAYPEFVMTDEMIDRFNAAIRGPGRELTGAIWNLFTEAGFGSRAPTMELVERIILRLEGEVREPSIEVIKRAAMREFSVTKAELEGPSKVRAYVYPRHIAMFLSRRMTRKSLPQIGRAFGNRDHATVFHCLRSLNKRMSTDEQLARDIARLEAAVGELMASNPN